MASSSPLKILILSDGRAGHFRRSEAIAAAIARRRPTKVETVQTRLPAWLPRKLETFLRTRLPPASYLRLIRGGKWSSFPPADLIISAGGSTLGTNIALAKLRGIPNIFSGNRCRTPQSVALTLTTYLPAASLPNHVFVLTPSQFDPDTLPLPQPWPGRLGVLIGGPTKQIVYGVDDWSRLAQLLDGLATAGASLTVATSPRTPTECYAALDPVSGRLDFIDFRKEGVGSANALFALDALIVTIDSMSMIAEAVAARRPVITLEPARVQHFRDAEVVDALASEGRLARVKISEATTAMVEKLIPSLTPTPENYLETLAKTILSHLSL